MIEWTILMLLFFILIRIISKQEHLENAKFSQGYTNIPSMIFKMRIAEIHLTVLTNENTKKLIQLLLKNEVKRREKIIQSLCPVPD